jgi:hypothetical protein
VAKSTDCWSVKGKAWKKISVQAALKIPRGKRYLRCSECRKMVSPVKRRSKGAEAHFRHRKWNGDCELCTWPAPESKRKKRRP